MYLVVRALCRQDSGQFPQGYVHKWFGLELQKHCENLLSKFPDVWKFQDRRKGQQQQQPLNSSPFFMLHSQVCVRIS
eukprot:6473182-Amphidinium_carterae.6